MFARYRATTLTPEWADHTLLELFRQGVYPSKLLGEVNQEFYDPSFEEMRLQPLNGWRLFNAVTFVLNGKILGSPQTTQTLHRVLDDVCVRLPLAYPGRTFDQEPLAVAA